MPEMPQGTGPAVAVYDARDFIERHGSGLSQVLQIAGGDAGIDLLCEARQRLDVLTPDPSQVGQSVQQMHDILEQAGYPDYTYSAPLRWHGARLSELMARLLE